MKTLKRLLVLLALITVSGVLMGGACGDDDDSILDGLDPETFCGSCGTIANGDATITGMAELDGIFKALGTLKMSTGTIKGNFDAHVRALAEGVFGITVTTQTTAELVAEIKTAYTAWIAANVEGGISLKYEPPKCSANVDVSIKAKAECEAKVSGGSCSAEVQCEPGTASFTCTGKCEGSCTGTCSAPTCEVAVTGPELTCEGECQGNCAAKLDVAAACSGKCEGTCSGNCSAYVKNASGEMECAGSCDATCQGKCEAKAEAGVTCTGECRGSCKLTGAQVTADCAAPKCEGTCDAQCKGGCEGEMTAPSCTGKAECTAPEASAKCEAQASAQASASLECTPPSLEIDYNFAAGVTAEAQVDFMAKLDTFRTEMTGIVQGMAELQGLFSADYAAKIGLERPPIEGIGAAIADFSAKLASGEITITAPGLLPCAIPAFSAAATVITTVTADANATITAQLELAGMVGIPL